MSGTDIEKASEMVLFLRIVPKPRGKHVVSYAQNALDPGLAYRIIIS